MWRWTKLFLTSSILLCLSIVLGQPLHEVSISSSFYNLLQPSSFHFSHCKVVQVTGTSDTSVPLVYTILLISSLVLGVLAHLILLFLDTSTTILCINSSAARAKKLKLVGLVCLIACTGMMLTVLVLEGKRKRDQGGESEGEFTRFRIGYWVLVFAVCASLGECGRLGVEVMGSSRGVAGGGECSSFLALFSSNG